MTDRRADPHEGPQPATTAYRHLATVELPHAVGPYTAARYSLIETSPHTGRRRQIRRHMKHIAHPVVGDPTNGEGRHNAFFRERYGCWRLLLVTPLPDWA